MHELAGLKNGFCKAMNFNKLPKLDKTHGLELQLQCKEDGNKCYGLCNIVSHVTCIKKLTCIKKTEGRTKKRAFQLSEKRKIPNDKRFLRLSKF